MFLSNWTAITSGGKSRDLTPDADTGNIDTAGLEKIPRANLPGIEAAFASSRFVEITRDAMVMHE